MKYKTSDVIAEFLEICGINTAFGIIGSANSHIFDSISKRGYTKIICVHHEQAAVIAMGAYFRASGKLSAAIVTAGAGASNAITGAVSNWADSIPGFIISGQEQSKFIEKYTGLRMYGVQGFNITKMVADITKYSKTVMDETEIQNILETAYRETQNLRPGPVWIDIPFDIQSTMIDKRQWNLTKSNPVVSSDTSPVATPNHDIDYVINQLHMAKRPLVWVGNGVRSSVCRNKFKHFIEKLNVPVILTWGASDMLPDEHSSYFGRAGIHGMRYSNFIVQNCDFLLVIGNRLSLLQTGYDINQFAIHAKIAVVDIDHTESLKHPSDKYDRLIAMDCNIFVDEMAKSETICYNPDWIVYCNKLKQKYPLIEPCHRNNDFINSYEFIDILNSNLTGNETIVTDMGTALLSGHYGIKMKENTRMFTSLGLGEMGYGLPGAIGAALANPDKNIICLNCDGGMMMNLQELQTISHHNLNIKIIIFDNDGYLMIKHTQNMLFNGYRTSVDKKTGVTCPNYNWIGDAFKIAVYDQIENSTFPKSTLTNFLKHEGPAILVVKMDPNQEFVPKVRGIVNTDGTISPALLEEMSPLLPYCEIEEAMISGVNQKSKMIKRT